MADFLVIVGIAVFVAAMLATPRAVVAAFGYLGMALFKPEWF